MEMGQAGWGVGCSCGSRKQDSHSRVTLHRIVVQKSERTYTLYQRASYFNFKNEWLLCSHFNLFFQIQWASVTSTSLLKFSGLKDLRLSKHYLFWIKTTSFLKCRTYKFSNKLSEQMGPPNIFSHGEENVPRPLIFLSHAENVTVESSRISKRGLILMYILADFGWEAG